MDGDHEQDQQPARTAGYTSTPGPTGIDVEVATSVIPLFEAKIKVDGRCLISDATRGSVHIPLPPGDHEVEVTNQQFLGPDFGAAHDRVPVIEGSTTRVYYRMPPVNFLSGVIGPEPRKVPGALFAYAVVGVLAVILVAALFTPAR